MNKIISTEERIFMSVVGPSGSGKTDLIFKILIGRTFSPKFNQILYFYKEMQQIYINVQQKLNIRFIRFTGFDNMPNLENCLVVFDDSCEEIYNEKEFVKLATAGRHRGVHVIFVKHNLYHQSKKSRTIDLNTTHIILFKSPRDVQQVEVLGKQLNLTVFLKNCYQKATERSFGHLLIDLSPKTSDFLRYCSNIVEPGPSVFYIPAKNAEITKITNEKEKSLYAKAYAKT